MKDSTMKNLEYELFPIGKLIVRDNYTFAHIMPDYRPALKNLKLFSHILVFSKPDREYNQSNCTGELKRVLSESMRIKALGRENEVDVTAAKVLSVNETEGILELDYMMVQDGTVIFDIKPYFPCEDRVKSFSVPDSIKDWPEWRKDDAGNANANASICNTEKLQESELKANYLIHQMGLIRKREGENLLELNNADPGFLKSLEGFSHIKILWWFNRFDKSTYRKTTQCNPPYENAPRTGVFASRSPVRPNPIAVTTAKVLSIDAPNNLIKVSDLDAFDKTPFLDIIPYIPMCDRVREFYVPEWLSHWPEWAEELQSNHALGDIGLIDSDFERIKAFSTAEKTSKESHKRLFDHHECESVSSSNEIIIRGARQNNLKDINLSIPKNKMTVITGVSGSGKSSLAFDTVFAESQRRFMDSMSTSGRALFEQMEKPDFDQITGLPPAVAIEQKTVGRNPRSTVGTMTDIYDYLRLLFSKIGRRHCPECGRAISPIKADEILKILKNLLPGTVFTIKGFNSEEILGEFKVPYEENIGWDLYEKTLKEYVKQSLLTGKGAILVTVDQTDEFVFQTKAICYHCNRIFFDLSTSTFSFNNSESMCPVCKGLGVKLETDPELIVANPDISILDGASEWWGNLRKHRQKPNANWMRGEILALAEQMKVDLELPWKELPDEFKRQALYGSEGKEVSFTYENTNGRKGEIVRPVEGAYNSIVRLFRENSGDTANRIALAFMREKNCSGCHGERLAPEGRLVSIAKKRFPETVIMTIEELKSWVTCLPEKLTEEQLKIAAQILKELDRRLQNLIEVGVPYLTLDRAVPTLSGGETQRLRLAAQLGGGITNILYVLDEPSIGLHPKDHRMLIKIMSRLRDEGNTVLVVEHDADTMLAADRIIDIGPGAGEYGGKIIAQGTPEEIIEDLQSETGKYLKGIKSVGSFNRTGRKKPDGWIRVMGARHNNLKNIDVDFPLGILTCVTGVSGSGKSSLVSKTLYPVLARFLNKSDDIPGDYDSIEGLEKVDKVINVSQLPIGRTPRSNPATYTGVFDDIRNLFATTEEAKKRGYKQNRFSFNGKEGQCEACQGEGRKCVQMHFMPDIWVECSICHGKRFNGETLEIKYNGKTISDMLNMDVKEAVSFFKDNPKIISVLQTLYDVGLGYIKLGQSALTLSGGEAQRIKLAKELSRTDTGKTIYLLDEPTTGLHFSDIDNLLNILHRVTEAGNTVIVIEHNLDIMKNADWIIDLGPDGGSAGGHIIAQGTPEDVAQNENSYTGKILKSSLIRKP